jgi:hypothetical protein
MPMDENTLTLALQPLMEATLASFEEVIAQDTAAAIFPNLLDVVWQVGKFVAVLGRGMIQRYVDVRLRQAKAAHRLCSCGKAMAWHTTTEWVHGTQFGNVRVKDAYAYCRPCHESARPLHGWLGTGVERWSLALEEKVVDLASDESCGKAVAKLERQHPGAAVGRTSALRMLHEHGANARGFVAVKIAKALVEAATEGRQTGGVLELEAEFDGGMIPVATLEPIPTPEGQEPELTAVRGLPKRHKNCRWEEAKLGLIQVPGEVEGRLYSVRPTDELDESFQDLLAMACMKGWTEKTQVRGLADGAKHIRPRMADAFHACPFRFILDRPHAKEHLAEAGSELEQLGGQPKDVWAAAALAKLEDGKALDVVTELRTAAVHAANDTLRLAADYFERNHDAVAYKDYRERGWSTASSEVESGHRSVIQVRLKLAGTWWHPDNVPNILALRMIKANGWWAEYWKQQRQHWRERADEFRSIQPRTRLAAA